MDNHWNILMGALMAGFALGKLYGRNTMAPYRELLSSRQQSNLENALIERWPSGLFFVGLTIFFLLLLPLGVVSMVLKQPWLNALAVLCWLMAFTVCAIVGLRKTNRILREELGELRRREGLSSNPSRS